MKAEDMPTPRIDRVIGASYRTLGEAGRALQREAEAVERDLAVQTAIVKRAAGLLNRATMKTAVRDCSCSNCETWLAEARAFLSEIRERKE